MIAIRILIVDDDPIFASSVELATRKTGAVVVDVANDAESALLLLGEYSYPVIILDLDLGARGNGLEVLSWLRSNAPATTVIVVSAHFTDYVNELLKLFAVVKATFTKPVNVDIVARVTASFAGIG